MLRRIRQLGKLLCIASGLVMIAFAVAAFADLEDFVLGKFSAASRDTSEAILLLLLGVAFALYGWFSDLEQTDGRAGIEKR